MLTVLFERHIQENLCFADNKAADQLCIHTGLSVHASYTSVKADNAMHTEQRICFSTTK